VQNAQARAPTGIELRQNGQSRVVDSTSGSVLRLAISALTGFTTRKNTAAETRRKATTALRKLP
jgi:hypothetical protein